MSFKTRNTMKRIFALVLTIALVLGAIPATAIATGASDGAGCDNIYVADAGYDYPSEENAYIADEVSGDSNDEYEMECGYATESDNNNVGEHGVIYEVAAPFMPALFVPFSGMPIPGTANTVQVNSWQEIGIIVGVQGPGDVLDLVVGQDMPASVAITIPDGVTVFLRSDLPEGSNYSIFQDTGNTRHFIVDGGELHLGNVTLTSNSVTSSGGVTVTTGGHLHMYLDSMISDNTSSNGGGVSVTNATFTMHGGTIRENTASFGAGVHLDNSTFNMHNGTISQNSVPLFGSTNAGAGTAVRNGSTFIMHDGAINGNFNTIIGGGVYVNNSTFEMRGGQITNNEAHSLGGGVYTGMSSTFIMEDGTISYNIVHPAALVGSGGGVHLSSTTFVMEGGTISGNTVHDGTGGGVRMQNSSFTMTGGTISDNWALGPRGNGGGVYVGTIGGASIPSGTRGLFAMEGGVISGNTTSGNGGGVFVPEPATFVMEDGTISGNTAMGTGGGGIASGGGVYVLGTFTMEDGAINGGNTALQGGGVFVAPDAVFEMQDGAISNNIASSGGGVAAQNAIFEMQRGTISGNNASSNGGGVQLSEGSTFDMGGGTISNNTAVIGGGVRLDGLAGNPTTMTMDGNAAISGNIATNSGGGVFVNSGGGSVPHSILIMEGGTISGNTAQRGGGVEVWGLLTMNNGTISGNIVTAAIADSTAGGVHIAEGTFNMNGGAVENHTAGASARGVFISGSYGNAAHFNMTGGAIRNNTATGNGGGILALDTLGNFTIGGNAQISNNGAIYGGGIHTSRNLTMTGGTINGNTAASGGGVWVGNGALFVMDQGVAPNLTSGTIAGNTATGAQRFPAVLQGGGGVYILGEGSTFVMRAGNIHTNTAVRGGGVAGVNSAAFRMEAGGTPQNPAYGVISGNTTTGTTGDDGGGGVFFFTNTAVANYVRSSFIMEAGVIGGDSDNGEGNTAFGGGGVFLSRATTMELRGGRISGNEAYSGGGISLGATNTNNTLIMTGGTIGGIDGLGNQATHGGGVRMGSSTFDMHDGNIYGNQATNGGGVFVEMWTTLGPSNFNMYGGNIYDNTAAQNGGGVNITGILSTFTMTDGTIGHATNPALGNEAADGGGVFVNNGGTFEMHDGTISRNTASNIGGGVHAGWNGMFEMHDGIFNGNTAPFGGGVGIGLNGDFIMHDGEISGNTATSFGGGVHNDAGHFTMHDGLIDDNQATNGGGGVSQASSADSIFTMHDGTISNNTITSTTGGGGGVNVGAFATFTMADGEISGNTAPYGGGIFAWGQNTAEITTGIIINNTAIRRGGGIFTSAVVDYDNVTVNDYQNLTIGATVIFSGNTAFAAFTPPAVAPLLTNIGFAGTSVHNHPINNFDINFLIINPAVEITKAAAATVEQGAPLIYTLTIVNTGNVTLTGIVVTDNLPAQLQNPRNLQYPASVTASFTGQTLNATIASLAPNASVTITFTVTANAPVGQVITNTARAEVPTTAIYDESSATTTVVQPDDGGGNGNGNGGDPTPNPAVQITKSAPATVRPNAEITYMLTVRNTGNVTLTGLTVTDNLPTQLQDPRNLEYPVGVTAAFTGQTLNATIASLSPGQSVTISFVVTVDAPVGQVITNTATVNVPSMPGVSHQSSATTTVTNQQPEVTTPPVVPPVLPPGDTTTGSDSSVGLLTRPESGNETGLVIGYEPQATTGISTDTSTETGRINPQTGDSAGRIGILSATGLAVSLGALLLLGKSKKNKAA